MDRNEHTDFFAELVPAFFAFFLHLFNPVVLIKVLARNFYCRTFFRSLY